MPAALNAQERLTIIDNLFDVFRDHGYDGSSLADLSRATGLGKSSLYHHFPRGKEQMAEVVLAHGRAFIQSSVADVARSGQPLRARINQIVTALNELYASGRSSCVLGRLAVADIGAAGHQLAHETFELWATAIMELARESGMPPTRARHFAEDWIARVQGSLVLHSANGDQKPFERAMRALAKLAEKKPETGRSAKAG